LEQEKRARDSLREDVESLADQVSALEDERQKDGYANSLEEINALLEQERSNRDWTVTALRKELEEERKDRGLSMAVLRKDFKKELEALTVSLQEVSSPTEEALESQRNAAEAVSADLRNELESQRSAADAVCADLRNEFESQRSVADAVCADLRNELESQRNAADAVCADLRSEMKALSVSVQSMPMASLVSKCNSEKTLASGDTGHSENEDSSNGVSLEDVQTLFGKCMQQQREEVSKIDAQTEKLRMDLSSSSDTAHVRMQRIEQDLSDLQYEVRASQALQRCLVEAVNLNGESG